MKFEVVGKRETRKDAIAKVTGKAKYADDFFERDMLVGKVLRSPHAHALIKSIDVSRAKALPGVEAVITYKDLPAIKYGTAGHPWALEIEHRDVEDRYILTDKVRYSGEAVAAVVAVDALTAEKAMKLIDVEYEVLPFVLDPEEAIFPDAPLIHEDKPNNIISSFGEEIGDFEEDLKNADHVFEGVYETSIVQHSHLEIQTAYSYVDTDGRIVIVSSTQIPHIVRRIVGQALGLPWGRIRVIKPYIGGGFGNKQDVIIEPLTAAMSLAVKGRPVRYALTREECFFDTRTRHAMRFYMKTAVSKEGKLLGINIKNFCNNGAYASHGHTVPMSAGSKFRLLYNLNSIKYEPVTTYTNLPAAGAMRGYGCPQIFYALESHVEDIAKAMGMDPIELRKQNFISVGKEDPHSHVVVRSFGLNECIEKGKELIKWDEKLAKYKDQNGKKRRGLGMACFSYATGTFPHGFEIAGARIVMNQDGSVQLQIGATEIGQGSDTVLSQIAAEVLGLPLDMVHVISQQDTDITPFDTGAYASRQTFVSGAAVRKAAEEVKQKVLKLADKRIGLGIDQLDIKNARIVEKALGMEICSLEDIALESYYDRLNAAPITSDVTANCRTNAMAYGVTFTEVEVDMETGKVEVVEIYNVHDSGTIVNPLLAEGQVHGGVSMGLGFALTEQLLFDKKTGEPLNDNFLDYKLQTIMDTPEIGSAFVEIPDPAGCVGQKSLGENTTITPAPAIRNAVLNATGMAFSKIPLTPQVVFDKMKESGLL
ncbi:MAG TPA: xanthine dehydrogenase molybdenum-binding subunit XdhA [Negativicutes bacterium]|nr:xanthine dehydrogenase molybdenum-binding subunit XdhA [Negativicutes bacterium]